MNNIEIIKTENLVFKYIRYDENGKSEGYVTAVDGVDISVARGQFIAILGRNGSGKSTLAKHLNALLIPTSGTVWVNGLDTRAEEDTWEIRRSAGMVFQNPDNQIIATIVEEDVAFGPENLGVPPDEIRRRVDWALKAVGMTKYAESAPSRLSGGQKQRVAIAGILAMRPDCVIFDEPTAMLDPIGRRDVMDTIRMLHEDEGITVILITHFMEEAAQAQAVFVMESGKIIMQGPPREVLCQTGRMKAAGLDAPQAAELAADLRESGLPLPEGIISMEELERALIDLARVRGF